MSAPRTIFDRILDGEIPCHRILENDSVLAFLDIMPLSRGHTLVIPKERKAHLHELSPASGAALGAALVQVSQAVLRATGCESYNVLQNNGAPAHQAVFHVHFHIIPRDGNQGLGIGWVPGSLEDGPSLAEAIRAELDSPGHS